MSALDSLHNSLAAVNARSVIGQLGEPKAMGRTAEHLERKFGNGRPPDNEIVLKTLRRFIESGSLSAYRDIKNVCYGVLVPYQGAGPW